ncbi:hypothetical protein [uncultured Megasphaera sp.]|uniref:hypothetical protein n=1 Tax=uncultured Megasphaera sp. TaxID=165188 RepID=UPI00265A8FF0|nr:hypothetical protein [uncultured Megasphaera sp.]
MKNSTWRNQVRSIIRLAIWTVPVPFGAFASDKSLFASLSLLLFLILSITMPVTMGRRQRKQGERSDYASLPAVLYGGFVAMFVGIGVLNSLMTQSYWQTYSIRLPLFTLWMIGTLILQTAAAWGVDWWRAHQRQYWYSEFLDPLLYALPLPCSLMGMLLFPAVDDSEVTPSLVIGVIGIIGFGFIIMTVFVLATFAGYFFPPKKAAYTGWERGVRIGRIVVMALAWMVVQQLLFSNDTTVFREYVLQAMPVVQNNPFVFVTPFLFGAVIMIGSIALGNVVMGVCLRYRK